MELCVAAVEGGELAFAGPRVRMGLHWAKEGSVVHREHAVTRSRIFAGPGFVAATEIGEGAFGGQILMSQVRADPCYLKMLS